MLSVCVLSLCVLVGVYELEVEEWCRGGLVVCVCVGVVNGV